MHPFYRQKIKRSTNAFCGDFRDFSNRIAPLPRKEPRIARMSRIRDAVKSRSLVFVFQALRIGQGFWWPRVPDLHRPDAAICLQQHLWCKGVWSLRLRGVRSVRCSGLLLRGLVLFGCNIRWSGKMFLSLCQSLLPLNVLGFELCQPAEVEGRGEPVLRRLLLIRLTYV